MMFLEPHVNNQLTVVNGCFTVPNHMRILTFIYITSSKLINHCPNINATPMLPGTCQLSSANACPSYREHCLPLQVMLC